MEIIMGQSLEQFVAEVKADIEAFAADYRASHAANPEHYPLEMRDNNDGVWLEFFTDFMTRER
jgi:hypothetical protein